MSESSCRTSALKIIQHSSDVTEYRVQSSERWFDSSTYALVLLLLAIVTFASNNYRLLAGASLVALWLISKCRSVLFDSIFALPPHGIQLETHRGIPSTPITRSIPLFTSRRFIPLPSINDIIINEALYGWNVRYYLAVLCTVNEGFEKGGEKIVVRVIFENILPKFPVLKQVYLKLRADLLDHPSTSQSQASNLNDPTKPK